MNEDIIQNVSDTAFWVAHYRALESKRTDALFHDPLAEVLSAGKGQMIAKHMRAGRYTQWSVVIRTCVIDELIHKLVVSENIDAIVNLGAGLDTRPYRLSLPDSVTWIEADYPAVIQYKKEKLKNAVPKMRLEQTGIDLVDRQARLQFFSALSARFQKTLVLTEGVMPYLTNDQVALFAGDLAAQPNFQYWIVDYFSPQVMRYMKKRRNPQMKNAPFQFDPPDWKQFFQDNGWRIRELRYFGEETKKWRRQQPLPLPLLARLLMVFAPAEKKKAMERFVGYALLEKSR